MPSSVSSTSLCVTSPIAWSRDRWRQKLPQFLVNGFCALEYLDCKELFVILQFWALHVLSSRSPVGFLERKSNWSVQLRRWVTWTQIKWCTDDFARHPFVTRVYDVAILICVYYCYYPMMEARVVPNSNPKPSKFDLIYSRPLNFGIRITIKAWRHFLDGLMR